MQNKKAMVFLPMAFRMTFLSFYPFLKTTGAGSNPGIRRARRNNTSGQADFFISLTTVISENPLKKLREHKIKDERCQ
jgi:hypothetical protein